MVSKHWGDITSGLKVHHHTLESFREILANYDFILEYKKGEKIPSDFLSRYVKVESLHVGHNSGRNMQYKNAISGKKLQKEATLTNQTQRGQEKKVRFLSSCIINQT